MATPMVSIIDDDEDVRQSLQALIESVGYRALPFDSAESFLSSGALAETGCIVSDVQMPGLTGIELARHLARAGHRTPIILISAYATDELKRGPLTANVVSVLPKPLQLNALIETIASALGPRA